MSEQERLTSFINHLREHVISRWMFYSILIGLVAGLGAAAFFFALEWMKYFILYFLAGFPMEPPAGERLVHGMPHGSPRSWLLLLAPAIGGLISGLMVYGWAPEAEGHGTDAMIDAFHNKQGEIRTRVPYIKSIASVVTLATGGSAGREAKFGSGTSGRRVGDVGAVSGF